MDKPFKQTIKEVYFILLFLMAAGFFLRIKGLGAQSLWLDEAISSIAAESFLINGLPLLPSGILYDRGILNTFLIASSFKIFGINEFAARLPSVLFGTLTILLAYLIGSKWGNKRIGLIAALLVAFSVWEIAWSRQARMYQQLQFFYILSLYLFYELTRRRNLKMLVLLCFSVLGTLLSHEFGYVLIPVFLAYLIILVLKERGNMKMPGRKASALAALVLGFLLVFVYYKGVVSSVMETSTNYYDTYIYLLKRDLGIFLFLAVPGGTVIVNRDWKKGLLLIVSLIIPLYIIFFHVLLIGTRYLYLVVPVLFILIGYFLDAVINFLSLNLSKNEGLLDWKKRVVCFSMILFLIFAMYFSQGFTFMPKDKYDLGVNAPQSDFKKAYGYVKDNMQQEDAIISTWTPPSLFYLGKSDYWLAFNVVGTGIDSFMVNSTEVYTNATAIKNVEMLKDTMQKYEKGWIITDNLAWYKLRPEIRKYVENNADEKLHDVTVRVYMWNGSLTLSTAKAGDS